VEAQRARASLIRRVSSARDQPMHNLTEASAYDPFLCLPPLPSPVSHAGKHTFGRARAPTPTHLNLLGLHEDPSDEMDCGEDDGSGEDGRANPPNTARGQFGNRTNEIWPPLTHP